MVSLGASFGNATKVNDFQAFLSLGGLVHTQELVARAAGQRQCSQRSHHYFRVHSFNFSHSPPTTVNDSSIYNENFEQSLQKGLRDIINIYNNSNYKPYFSLQCNYYCNLNIKNDNNYNITQYEKMLEHLAKKIDGNFNSNLNNFNETNESNSKEV